MLEKITFEIETITPMFLAGAEQGKAELRAASLKGLLRFWWRALQAESDIEKLRNRESQIFGSSDEKLGGGSSFSIRIVHEGALKTSKVSLPKQNISVTSKGKTFHVNILEYLAYGTLEYKKGEGNVFIREYIPAATKFTLIINLKDTFAHEVLKTFYAFNLFGCIGSRSRNGFGSFVIVNNDEAFELIRPDFSVSQPYSNDNLKKLIKQVGSSSYASFSQEAKLFKTKTAHDTWDKALGEIGKIYRGIRSSDMKMDNQTFFESKHVYDKRQYLGAPLDPPKESFKSILDRHGKPYFIKVAKEDSKYRSYILYLPSQYCTGLSEDRNRKPINHNVANIKFTEACNEFNAFLREHMESIL